MTRRIQNKIAGSRYALPITVAYVLLAFLFFGLSDVGQWVSLGSLLLSMLLMVLLNNVNALIRIYSRMVSCSFLVLTVMHMALMPVMQQEVATFALPGNLVSDIVQPCFIASFLFFFNAYQDKFSPGWVFFSFLFIGIASIFFVPMLFYLPLLWILLGANVLALSLRNFCASLLGILLPFWVVGSYALYADRLSEFGDYCLTIGSLGPLFDYSQIALPQIISFAFVVVLLLTGTVHFLRNSYRDKIRTRMIYESLITIGLFTVLFILAQPQHFNTLMRVLIVVTSPLIAHFIALTETRITNIATIVIMVVTFLITFCNRWMLSLLS